MYSVDRKGYLKIIIVKHRKNGKLFVTYMYVTYVFNIQVRGVLPLKVVCNLDTVVVLCD